MKAASVQRSPATSSSVWTREPGEVRTPGVAHLIAVVVLIIVGIVLGTFGSIAIPLGFVSAFWPGQAVQAIGGIWFGIWGVIAGALFPFISNLPLFSGSDLPAWNTSLAYVPANLIQGFVAFLAFRTLKADPRLLTGRDWLVWIGGGVFLANILGGLWGTFMLYQLGMVTAGAWAVSWLAWIVGNSMPSLLLGSLVLKFGSPAMLKTKAFVKGWFA